MDIRVVQGDALQITADVLVLKYAQMLHGVDRLVVDQLDAAGSEVRANLPGPDGFDLINAAGRIAARSVLIVGVEPLQAFGYEAIRAFARRALNFLARVKAPTEHIAFTLHGAGYGLDESEAFRAELGGILDAFETGEVPAVVRLITIVERDVGRARRLEKLLEAILPGRNAKPTIAAGQVEQLRTAGARSGSKPHIFVAMPFAPEFDDHFHYGIYPTVTDAGYLCERADLATFTGDVIMWVKERIASARLLVADLSMANPNVYLEVGYAWGKGIPTILLARDEADLLFDVKGQRCLLYNSIRRLEGALRSELRVLRG